MAAAYLRAPSQERVAEERRIERLAACDGKAAFPNRSTAERAAQRTRRRKERPVNTYQCFACGKWHVGANSTHH